MDTMPHSYSFWLYTRYPIVARALGLAAFRPSARASKGILHTKFLVDIRYTRKSCIQGVPLLKL